MEMDGLDPAKHIPERFRITRPLSDPNNPATHANYDISLDSIRKPSATKVQQDYQNALNLVKQYTPQLPGLMR